MKGSLVTLATLVAIELLSRTVLKIPNPEPIYLCAVVYAAFSGGLRSGAMSAVLTLLHALYFFSIPGQLWHDNAENLQRLFVLFVTTPAIAAMVGSLKRGGARNLPSPSSLAQKAFLELIHRLSAIVWKRDPATLQFTFVTQPIARASSPAGQALLNALLESAPIGLAFFDRQLRFVQINECLATINGIPATQHLGLTVKEILPPELSRAVYEMQRRVLDTGKPLLNVEHTGETLAAPGQQRYWLTNFYPVYSPNQEILGIGLAVTEITALKKSEERFRVAQEISLDGFTILRSVRDARGEIVDFEWEYANPKAAEILQHSVETLLGKRLLNVLPSDREARELFDSYARVVETGKPHDIDIPYKSKDNNRCFRNMAVKLGDGLAVSFSDISERKRAEEELHRREREFKALAENVPDIIARVDRDFRHLYVNPAIERVTGIPPEAFIGKNHAELGFPEEIYLPWYENLRKILATKREVFVEFNFDSPRGRRYYQSHLVPELDLDGSVKSILGISRDVTEYKQTEQALRESEERFRRVVESHMIGMGCWDIDGNITEPNDAFLQLIAYSREDLNTEKINWQRITPPEYQHLDDRAIQECKELGFCTPFEKEYIRKDGSRIPILVGGALFEESREKGVFFVLDLTERKRADKQLRESEERLRLSLEAGHMGIWDWNILTGEIKWSDNLEAIHGMAPGSFEGTFEAFLEIIHPEDCERVKEAIATAVENKTDYDLEFRIIDSDGSIRWIVGKGKIFCDVAGNAVRMLGVGMDISDRKKIQIELEQQAEKLASANRIKDEFLAVLSHELRSPLNAILGWAQLLRTGKFNETMTAKALESIERNAKLQTQLVEDLLDVSRIIRGKLSLNIYSVNVASILEVILENVRLAAAAKSISIEPFIEANVGMVMGDPNRLQQIIWNLVSNAIKFTPEAGRVEIRLSKVIGNREKGIGQPYAQIQVSDTGIGISAEFLPHIFDYFQQADSSITRKYGGLGLGLAIVRYLVEMHGGTIAAESPGMGEGATFTVKLPLKEVASEQFSWGVGEEKSMPNGTLSGLRVLVVDDEADARDFLSAVLAKYGAEAIAVASATEALDVLEALKPDVLVSDIGMPEEDGYALIRQVRARETAQGSPQIPAAAITAYARDEDRLKALQAGFNQHVCKPVEPVELAKAIASLAQLLDVPVGSEL